MVKQYLQKNWPTGVKIIASLVFVVLGLSLIFYKPQTSINSNSFSSEPVEIKGLSEAEFSEDDLPQRIIIPSLKVDIHVRRSEIVEGYWVVYEDSAGWGEGSGIPGRPGNQVVFAHARDKLFLPLKDIEVGSDVYILTKKGWFSYTVVDLKEVTPDRIEVIEPTEDETLTLYTCSGFGDTKRLIVIAKRK